MASTWSMAGMPHRPEWWLHLPYAHFQDPPMTATLPGATDADALSTLIARWREDAGGAYRTWFLWEERLNNFRAIRRGVQAVVTEIAHGTFGSTYRAPRWRLWFVPWPSSVKSSRAQIMLSCGSPNCASPTSTKMPNISERSGGFSTRACAAAATHRSSKRSMRWTADASRDWDPRRRISCISFTRRICRPSTRRSSTATTPLPVLASSSAAGRNTWLCAEGCRSW